MPAEIPSRRARLRAQTTAEIKSVALDLMAGGGPGAITLRSIARRMGMTPNAIYGYFATHHDLLTALIQEVYTSLADTLDSACGHPGSVDPDSALTAWGQAYRRWAKANPQGFRLIYGDVAPGYEPPPGGAAPDAEQRVCFGLAALVNAMWPNAGSLYAESAYQWSDFDSEPLNREIQKMFPDLPAAGVALGLRIWGHVHGIVSLEIYGHLQTAAAPAVDRIFTDELNYLTRSLNATPSA